MTLDIAGGLAAGGQRGRGVTGLAAGTRVLTRDGAIPVDWLMAGDRIITRDAGYATLLALEGRPATGEGLVRLARGALGRDRPDRDLLLAPDQPVFLRGATARALAGLDAVAVPVAALVDGRAIAAVAAAEGARLCTLVFAEPHVVYADGVELVAATPAFATAA